VATFLEGGEGILRGLKPGLLRVCYDQGSRFISTQGRLPFDSPTVSTGSQHDKSGVDHPKPVLTFRNHLRRCLNGS
jgi:hypothetical protein